MNQRHPLESVAPGLQKLAEENEALQNLIQAPYFIQSMHILLCAYGDLRALLHTMYLDEEISSDLYGKLRGEASNLYANALGI